MIEIIVPIVVAHITSGLTFCGVIVANRKSNVEMMAQLMQDSAVSDATIQGQINMIQKQIEELTKQVEKHNQVIERTYNLEQKMAVAEEQFMHTHIWI